MNDALIIHKEGTDSDDDAGEEHGINADLAPEMSFAGREASTGSR